MMLAVIDMMKAGKAVSIGWKTIGLYAVGTCAAAIEGLCIVLIFKRWFSRKEEDPESILPLFNIFCDQGKNSILAQNASTGVIECVAATAMETMSNVTNFLMDDINNVFAIAKGSGIKNDVSLSETVQNGVFKNLVSGNIVADLANASFLSVITFSLFFGVALISVGKKHHNGQLPPTIINAVTEANHTLVLMIEWIIHLTPIAVCSLICGALAGQKNLGATFTDVGVLIGAAVCGYAFHLLVFYPTFFFVLLRKNPYAYMKNLLPAQCMAFACSSSAATLPVNIQCAVDSKEVPKTLANFVLSLGATINMDGTALYFPVALVFLGMMNGEEITVASYFLIFLLSTLGSIGSSPVPSAQLVLVITAYNTIFSTTGTPDKFGLLVMIDWFLDRCATLVNVTGDNIICRIVSGLEGDGLDFGTEESDTGSENAAKDLDMNSGDFCVTVEDVSGFNDGKKN